MSGGPSVEMLRRARTWCARQFSARYSWRDGHASHLACQILREADEKFALESFGDEGFCDEIGSEGVSYLNMGDTYTLTLCVETSARSAKFLVSSWGAIAERSESERDSE
jgi:hypothetical protein